MFNTKKKNDTAKLIIRVRCGCLRYIPRGSW